MVKRTELLPMACETPRRSPIELAQAAGESSNAAQRQSLRLDLERWREIVLDIADGTEPGSECLAEIVGLAQRLHMRPGALASHVSAVEHERRLVAQTVEHREIVDQLQARMPAMKSELIAARERVRELEKEVGRIEYAPTVVGGLIGETIRVRIDCPVIFGDVGQLVEQFLGIESRTIETVPTSQQKAWEATVALERAPHQTECDQLAMARVHGVRP